jgi:AraC family transcriptional activator of pobA
MAIKNKKSLEVGLYGEETAPFLPDFVHYELLESRSSSHNWEINVHAHPQLCQVFLFESGNVILKTNNSELSLPLPCVLFVPENTAHGFSFLPNSTGRVLTLSVSFIENLFQSSPDILNAFATVHQIDTQIEAESYQKMRTILISIQDELADNQPQRNLALQTRLTLFFIELFRLSDQRIDNIKTIDRNLSHYQEFQRLIQKNYLTQQSMNQYANQLNMTSVHLNRICQKLVGKTASEVLQEYIVNEAKKYLKHTSYSVSEIAYRLNFEYPSYFTRLFKKHTGLSPKGFRAEG